MTRFPDVVQSPQNSRIKQLRRYLRVPQSEETPWVAVEGWKSILEASSSTFPALLVTAEDCRYPMQQVNAKSLLRVNRKVFRELSQVESATGIIAFFEKPLWDWATLPPVLLFLDQLQDPGNLGTLLRCAAAAGDSGIVASPGTVSRFNAKVVRASAGTVFSVPMRERESATSVIGRGYRLLAACPDRGESLFQTDLSHPLVIALGNEGEGLRPEILEMAQARVRIPVRTGAPSLNAAIAGAIVLFELRRRSEL